MNTIHEQYKADGFLINATPIIPQVVVDAAVIGMDEVRMGHYDTGTPPMPSPWKPGDDPTSKLCKIELPQIANRAIMNLLCHPALGQLAAAVSGAKAVQIWWVQLLYKPTLLAGAPIKTNVGWHQDRHYWGNWDSESDLFTAWVALSDVTLDAGPMVFVKGSHQWGKGGGSDFFGQDLEMLKASIQREHHQSWQEVTAVLPPGGVSFHDDLTYHGSGPNTSGLPRRSFAIHMRTERSRPKEGQRAGLSQFIDNLDYNPVIYGKRSDFWE
jgi:Phytanoyl-CoA dioxygenase (PhyH)